MLGPLGVSPPTSSSLSLLESELQPHAMIRSHEFKCGRRIFHVHFGHGYVQALETDPTLDAAKSAGPQERHEVVSSKTYNIKVHFDNPRHSVVRLRAFYAVPKMVVIPSSSCLHRRKLQQAIETAGSAPHARTALVGQMIARGALVDACALVQRWGLQAAFDPAQLLQLLLQSKHYSAAFRYAREFGLKQLYPTQALLQRMLQDKYYEGALKYVGANASSVDGEHAPADVLQLLVRSGKHDVALKYVHKFRATSRFPPAQLVGRCLSRQGDLTVRCCAMLLKYVKLFGLESSYPTASLIERASRSGIHVTSLENKYVFKGRRRQAATGCSGLGQSHGMRGASAPN